MSGVPKQLESGPLAPRDVDMLIEAMRPGVPYEMPDLHQRYVRLMLFEGRTPGTRHALGKALKARGLVSGRYHDKRTWMVP